MRSDSPSFASSSRRLQITRAAIEVLAAEGYTAASMSAIAGRIGVSKGVLTYHFASKAELLQDIVRFVLADAAAWMTPRMAGAPSYRAALHLYISSNVSYLAAHRAEILALTEVLANARATAGVPEMFEASQSEAIRGLEQLFAGGQAAGEFGDVPTRMLAVSLRATIDSTSQSIQSDPAFDLVSFGDELTRLFDRATAQPEQDKHEDEDEDERKAP
jgi:AcrR family transcriptional regulator